ncbi:hypothetical protein ES705_08733 [subsurface metagenome]
MKTIYKVPILSGMLLLIVAGIICSRLNAQTIISIESSSDSTIIVKIQDKVFTDKPQKLILILDSTQLTYRLSEVGDLALEYSQQSSTYIRSSIICSNTKRSEIGKKDSNRMEDLNYAIIAEETEDEDDVVLEDWMFNHKEWLVEKEN